jgi:regulator of protease activity HflC (stomatin/prohibitin superfamily)
LKFKEKIIDFIVSILLVIVFILFLSGIRVVQQQNVAIVERFGEYSRSLTAGLNWVFPMVDKIVEVVNLRIQEIKSEVQVKTIDNMFVELPVNIMVVPEANRAADSFYKLQDPNRQIKSWVLNAVRSTASEMKFEDLFTDRAHIVTQIKKELDEKLKSYGYHVEDVLVDQPSVTDDVKHAFNRVLAAKREAESAMQEGEAAKIKAVALANAEAESQRIRSQGMADARAILAKGLNDSVQEFKNSDISAEHVMSVLVELNRLDVLRDVGQKGNTILMNLGDSKEAKLDALVGLTSKKGVKKPNEV